MEKDFFEAQTASSKIKATIVAQYFPQYCKIILKKPQPKIIYLDLFSGPGKYQDENYSTPLLLATSCASNPILKQKVHFLFNDMEYSDELKSNFFQIFPVGTFAYEPKFGNKIVGEDDKITNYLSKPPITPNPAPTLLFFDPYGWKTIDTIVLAKFLANWGNEIFLFVNIKRINQSIEVGKFDDMMRSLFPTTIEELRRNRKYNSATVHERLSLIMDNLATEFKKAVNGNLFTCAFKFQEEDSQATSHFIIHFTKHPKGYELVKQIYGEYDNIGANLEKDGSYTFDVKKTDRANYATLDFGNPNIEALSKQILQEFSGKKLSAKSLFDQHHVGNNWGPKHYVDALRDLHKREKVKATYTDKIDHKMAVLLTDQCILDFN